MQSMMGHVNFILNYLIETLLSEPKEWSRWEDITVALLNKDEDKRKVETSQYYTGK